MTVATLLRSHRSLAAGVPTIERRDIQFISIGADRVRFEVTARNAGRTPTPPLPLLMEVAPLGAFVPGVSVAPLILPRLGPGEERAVSFDARRARRQPLGPPDRVPPGLLLTALASDDRNRKSGSIVTLPADPLELIHGSNPYFAGNLNIFVNETPVERHMTNAVRMYPGRMNVAMFMVGSPRRDVYSFRVEQSDRNWNVELFNMTEARSVAYADRGAAIDSDCELEVKRPGLVLLAVQPPSDAVAGTVNIHVRQRSTGRDAVVEFTLDARAAGPGCYVV